MNDVFNLSQAQAESIERSAKAEWDRVAEIRAEFGTLATYTAYKKANAAGKIKVLGGGSRVDVTVNMRR